jgi:hypothetical protein
MLYFKTFILSFITYFSTALFLRGTSVIESTDAESFGLYELHGDATNRLQSLFDNPSIKKIIFRQPQKSKLFINGNIYIPTGKALVFDGSVMIGGAGVITGGIISAPANVQIFDTTLTLQGTKVAGNFFSACWFGAVADGRTFNDAALKKSFSSAPEGMQVRLPAGKLLIKETLYISRSLSSDSTSSIKLDSACPAPGIVMTCVKAPGISISNIAFDGSNKAFWIMEITNNQNNVEIANCAISGAEQLEGGKNAAAGIRFREGMDGLHIHDCHFSNINASISGVARGILGSGKTCPKDVIIEYNTFDGITNVGAKNWDADQIVIQDYKDTSNMIIRYNQHHNISKRGEKLQCAGLTSYKNEFWSTRYKTDNKRSYSAISAYANNITVTENIVHEGVYETGIEVGVITGASFNNITVQKNKLLLSVTTLGINDGIRVIGKRITHLNISDNYIENVRKGIWLDCGSSGTIIENNEVKNSMDNAFCVNGSSNSWPDTWNNNITFVNNKASDVKAYVAFELTKIAGGNISGNSAETQQLTIKTNGLDSITGNIIMRDNKGPGSFNSGTAKERPVIKNPAACIGLQYYNTDNKKTETWNGNAWITNE